MEKRKEKFRVDKIAKWIVVGYVDSCRNVDTEEAMSFDTYEEAQAEAKDQAAALLENNYAAIDRILVCQVWGFVVPPKPENVEYVELPD